MLRNCLNNLCLLTAIFFCLRPASTNGQQRVGGNVASLVDNYKLIYPVLAKKSLFTGVSERDGKEGEVLNEFTSLKLDLDQLEQLVDAAEGGIELTIPFKNSSITVELIKVDLFTNDFKVVTDVSGEQAVSYHPGIYYRGTVKGEPTFLASFSFFNDEVNGLITTGEGNVVIGQLINDNPQKDEYIIYSDLDFKSPLSTTCATYDDPAYAPDLTKLLESTSTIRTTNCVRIYYEIDNAIFQNNGLSINNTINWITSIHNNVAMLYSNDNINTAISEIFVWTLTDPFFHTSSITQLNTFKSYRASFNGDVGQLLSIEPGVLGGVASGLNALCNSENKYCYSDVEFSYNTVPTYSWTVNVVTHEFGHLLGSYHTHNCNWPGGAIDNCGPLAGYPNEGNCLLGPTPVNGGTIMSYCHLTTFGINFINGFGPLPGLAIQSAVDGSSCLTASCVPNLPAYCMSLSQSTSGEWIQSVNLTTLNVTSGAGSGYSDFTNHVADLQPGSTVSITLTPAYSGSHYEELFSVWIDYNKDLDFYDANENVFQSAPVTGPVTGTFLIPSGLAGNTRMRISMKFDTLASPCESFKYGEVEDYAVSFTPLVSYCGSYGKKTDQEWIDFVSLGTINRTSASDNGYFDGTAIATTLALNSQYNLTFSAGYSDHHFKEYWKAWIDYNGNGEFENKETIITKNSNKKGTISKDFIIPSTASIGKTRMRISMKRSNQPTPCDTFTNGEVEDYSIQLVPQNIGTPVSSSLTSSTSSAFTVELYPNPASREMMARFSEPVNSGQLQLMNLVGQVIHTENITAESTNLLFDVGGFTPGVYLMQLYIPGEKVITKKWIKE